MGEGKSKEFLEEKYLDLQQSEEVKSAVHRQEVRTGEKVKQQPKERIEVYLDRLEEVFNNPDKSKKERKIDILKDKLHEKFIIKPDEIPEGYFELQKRIARERGHGDIEINDWMRKELTNNAIVNQTKSLDRWIDYLSSQETAYPNWFKYFVFRNITQLGEFDKQKKEFKKRSKGTTGMFPDINSEALSYVSDVLIKKYVKKEKIHDKELEKLLQGANFAKIYTHAIEKITPANQEQKETIKGEWMKYDRIERNDEEKGRIDPVVEKLCKSLQNHGTGWCTAGEDTARRQLEEGDFYVYYTEDKDGGNTVPRIAIRMEHGEIAEVSGIEKDQGVESKLLDVVKEKMSGLPGHEEYDKKISDMKRLTEIEKKIMDAKQQKPKLTHGNYKSLNSLPDQEIDDRITKEDLLFLYEFNGHIEGFGREEDPRIEELREGRKENLEADARLLLERNTAIEDKIKRGEKLSREEVEYIYEIESKADAFPDGTKDPRIDEFRLQRNPEEDACILFGCAPQDIAWKENEVTNKTKVYIGPLFPGVFDLNLEYVTTSFPKKIERCDVEIGGKTKSELQSELEKGFSLMGVSDCMVNSEGFTTSETHEQVNLIWLSIADLGLPEGVKTDQVYERAKELGLDLCPAEVAPRLLSLPSHREREPFRVAMKPIMITDYFIKLGKDIVCAAIFKIYPYDTKSWRIKEEVVDDVLPNSPVRWSTNRLFVFRLRPHSEKKNMSTV